MKKWTLLILASSAMDVAACDWRIASDKIDPMTDQRACLIMSKAAEIGISVRGQEVIFLTGSAYKSGRDGLTLRIDENKAIWMGEHRSTSAFKDNARQAMSEIRNGARLRTQYLDYPSSKNGDTEICTLPALIDSCLTGQPIKSDTPTSPQMKWKPKGY